MMRFKAWQLNMFGFLVVVTLVCSSVAWGAPLAGGLGIRNGANTISDDDFEVLVNSVGSPTTIERGDILFGAFGINGINGTPGSAFDQEITVIYALEVTSVTAHGGPAAGAACLNLSSTSCSFFTFGTIGSTGLSGFTDINQVIDAALPGNTLPTYLSIDDVNPLPAGTVALTFIDPAKDFISPDIAGTTFDALITSADGGQALLAATLGIGSLGILGNAPANLLELTQCPLSVPPGPPSPLCPGGTNPFASVYAPGQAAGSIGVDFSVLEQAFPGFTITSSLRGISNITEPGGVNPTLQNRGVRTDTTLSFDAALTAVPEPATFMLFGSALLLLGGIKVLRRKRAQL